MHFCNAKPRTLIKVLFEAYSLSQHPLHLSADSDQLDVTDSIFIADQVSWQVDELQILDNLSFEVKRNEFLGFIGPNGAGKSSLLRCLFGKNGISSGSLSFNQQAINQYSRRELAQQIAVLIQEPPTQFEMSVFDVVAMGLIPNRPLFSFSTQEDQQTITHALEKVELLNKAQNAFNTLSGGEKQRVMVARAIVQDPKVLILDEPTNHLDIQHQIDVLQLAKEMNITVLLSIHDLNMAAAFCDRLILMKEGRIITSGEPDSVLTRDNLEYVFNIRAQVDSHPFHSGKRITYDFSPDTQIKKSIISPKDISELGMEK
jgi:iron complex transport system ATP-binding protein